MSTTQNTRKSLVNRVYRVVKMNLTNPWPALIIPILILSILVLAAVVLGGIFGGGLDGEVYFSPEFFFMTVLLVVANQAINHHYPLALSYGLTRRDFYLGSVVTFILLALLYSVISLLLGLIPGPRALIEFGQPGWPQFVLTFWALLISQLLGAAITTIYLRWKRVGMVTFFILLGVAIVAAPILLSRYDLWDPLQRALGADLGDLNSNLIGLGWALALALAGYLIIRRAVPNR